MALSSVTFKLTSPSFVDGQPIPFRHTCEGTGVSPALEWTDAPPGTVSFLLLVNDPDAPDPEAPQRDFVHWVCAFPASRHRIEEGERLGPDAIEGMNDFGERGWRGPCPPRGRHRYFFRIFALDAKPSLPQAPTRGDAQVAMKGHVLAEAVLMGVYEKAQR